MCSLELDEVHVPLRRRGRDDGDVAAGGQAHHAAAGQIPEVAFGHGGRWRASPDGLPISVASPPEHREARLQVLAGDLGVFVQLQVARWR